MRPASLTTLEWPTRAGIDVEQAATVVLVSATKAREIARSARDIAADPEVHRISGEMIGFRRTTDTGIVPSATARR